MAGDSLKPRRPRYGAQDLERLVDERTRELAALFTHLHELAEREKAALAHRLHDELGGLLTAAKMDLSWLQSRLMQQPPPVHERLRQLANALDAAMDVKRRVVEELRPSLLDHFGLSAALEAYIGSVCDPAGLECEIAILDDAAIPDEIAIALFRVVQEAVANVIRHARARRIRLELGSDARVHRLALTDDGQGFDPADPACRGSHGLTIMRERIKALRGRLVLRSARGAGTALDIEVPRRSVASP